MFSDEMQIAFTESGSVLLRLTVLGSLVGNGPEQLDLPLHSLNKSTVTSLANHTEEPEMLCHQDDIPLSGRGRQRMGTRLTPQPEQVELIR